MSECSSKRERYIRQRSYCVVGEQRTTLMTMSAPFERECSRSTLETLDKDEQTEINNTSGTRVCAVTSRRTLPVMSSPQSPMIAIPKKTADEVDWTTPIRNVIAKSYGENPENYAQEYQALQRCRQDAVKGAGSDLTGLHLSLVSLITPSSTHRTRSPLQVLWPARTPRAPLLRDPCQLLMARRLY